ncbi:MAG TPA: acyl-CoA dehydrogenase family protein, partial [Methylomirabilota bacterium]|nr:acyl-CoA dehydrogenase family protein [Methylomirabilota bacterium]
MDFALPEAQQLLADTVRRFARDRLAEGALQRAHDPRFPFDVARLAAAQGLLGITLPESDGGQGGTLLDAVIAIEQTALVCPRSADVIQAGNFGPIRTLAEYASPAQKAKFLPALLSGEAVISLGMSEP